VIGSPANDRQHPAIALRVSVPAQRGQTPHIVVCRSGLRVPEGHTLCRRNGASKSVILVNTLDIFGVTAANFGAPLPPRLQGPVPRLENLIEVHGEEHPGR
jgi:hypothetical protein